MWDTHRFKNKMLKKTDFSDSKSPKLSTNVSLEQSYLPKFQLLTYTCLSDNFSLHCHFMYVLWYTGWTQYPKHGSRVKIMLKYIYIGLFAFVLDVRQLKSKQETSSSIFERMTLFTNLNYAPINRTHHWHFNQLSIKC